METANIQSVVENNIVSVALMNIQPSSYNPRKHFDEVSLAELAESIRQQGVLQPIGVRPIADTDRFEIVFGERRYRAALMAELTEISAVILHVSDETAAEMAVTENLQRKDVTPIEEANAYQKLMESGRYDVQSLAEQFGKNENYIRTRLKFVSLIPEIAELLEKDEITISVASEICRYGTDIQKEVYYKHLKDSDSMLYDCWRGLKAAEVAKFIERDFTTDLSRYAFDKTLCASCPHNTNNMMLFCEGGCGNCANRSCLAEMNASYLVEKAVQFVEQYPSVSLCYQDFNNNMIAVERLTAMGYEVEHLKRKNTTLSRNTRRHTRSTSRISATIWKNASQSMNELTRANSRFILVSDRKKLRCVIWQVLPPMRTWLPKNNSPRWKNWRSRTNVTRK